VRGTTEVWRFINDSGVSHPMHMHLVFFQILDRDGFTRDGMGNIVPDGSPQAPSLEESGWKDTAMVGPNEILRVIARFEDYKGLYAYHCHILEHEDHEMMRQMSVPEPSAILGLGSCVLMLAWLARRRERHEGDRTSQSAARVLPSEGRQRIP
jgi:hypothetical protein